MHRPLLAIIAMLVALPILGCAGGGAAEPQEFCVKIEASTQLNLYEGEPHVVAVYFYPLQNATAFQEADFDDLLRRTELAGQTGQAWETTILPGEERDLQEMLPRETAVVGIVADFQAGPSRVVVDPECGIISNNSVVLTASDIQVQ